MMIRRIYLVISIWGMMIPTSYAQSAYRHLLLEHFTNTRCVLCPARNAQLYSLLDQYPGQVHHISIHPSVPYNNCVLYQHNPVDNNARKDLYGVNATPRAFLWGVSSSAGTTLLPETTLLNSLGKTAVMGLTVNEDGLGPLPQVMVDIRTFETPDSGEYRLFVAIVERIVDYAAPNGETEHRNVFRMMLPNADGETFTPHEKGGAASFSYTYTPDAEWDMAQIYAVAFVQNMTTKEVLNSGTASDLRLSLIASSDGMAVAQALGGIPPYTYQWNDPDSQTTAAAIGLGLGLYTVRVTDSVGVTMSDTVRIQTATALVDENEYDLKVFPSPAKEKLFVDSRFPVSQIYLVDLNGRKVGDWKLVPGESITLNLPSVESGIYFLRIYTRGNVIDRKIFVE
ncbi:MAG: Omp28-related outer membrane protein [Bacteroidia bacterium]